MGIWWEDGRSKSDRLNHPLKYAEKNINLISNLVLRKILGFSKKEFALLKEASANSDGLIATEDQAMKTIKQGKVIDGPLKPNSN